jgi:hypothetical protein
MRAGAEPTTLHTRTVIRGELLMKAGAVMHPPRPHVTNRVTKANAILCPA